MAGDRLMRFFDEVPAGSGGAGNPLDRSLLGAMPGDAREMHAQMGGGSSYYKPRDPSEQRDEYVHTKPVGRCVSSKVPQPI